MNNTNDNLFFESKIRPGDLYQEWRRKLKDELDIFFNDKNSLVDVHCVGCDSVNYSYAFDIWDFPYHRCNNCGTLFASKRPTEEELKKFYQVSEAYTFWKNKVIDSTKESRIKNSLLPIHRWFIDMVEELKPEAKLALEYRPKYYSIFDQVSPEFANSIEKFIFVDPFHLDCINNDKIEIVEDLQGVGESPDIVTAFNVLDREFSPSEFIKKLANFCESGTLLFLTTNTSSGFEYQILGKNSSRLVLPDRLNLLSIKAIEDLLEKFGFEVVELSTPGKLDVEIVSKTFENNLDLEVPEFFKYIFKHRDINVQKSLQDFLRLNNLSSFLRVVAIKK